MKIYTVNHYYDNGESYEDYREYEDILYYSTLDKAWSVFWEKVTSNYEGIIRLKELTLDTQEAITLEESVWIDCKNSWDYPSEPDYMDNYDDYYYDNFDYDRDYNDAIWETYEDEIYAIDEWLTHEGENYKIFEEINAIRLTNLLKDLEELTSCHTDSCVV
jgi:hypothetical protein